MEWRNASQPLNLRVNFIQLERFLPVGEGFDRVGGKLNPRDCDVSQAIHVLEQMPDGIEYSASCGVAGWDSYLPVFCRWQ